MLRLTGGEFRGRAIQTPKTDRTRPTQAKLRQAMFNSLQTRIAGARVLDLFAGSGALGFEALSRGADFVTFVESARPVAKLIAKNAADLGVADRVEIIEDSVSRAGTGLWKKAAHLGLFDIVLADPPYAEEWELPLLKLTPWSDVLNAGGVFCLEWGAVKSAVKELPQEAPFLVKIREKNYGDSILSTFERKPEV